MVAMFDCTELQGDYDKAGVYYMASVKEISKPQEFIFPYYGQLRSVIQNLLCLNFVQVRYFGIVLLMISI